MKKAPIPKNEETRLRELQSYEILDSEAEEIFNEITEIAKEICNVKISLVSLIDEERQWFKASCGLSAKETPRDISYCGHTIMGNEIFEVKDSSKDERFIDNPLHTGEPHVRYYAGAPLINSNGLALGTLCVIDDQPNELSNMQKEILRKLANQVVAHIETRKLNIQLEKKTKLIKDTQSKLFENSKLVALGELAGGVAHEINNPLAIISFAAESGLIDIEKDEFSIEETKYNYEKILKTVERITNIVTGLKKFSRTSMSKIERCNLADLLKETLMLCQEKFKNNGIFLENTALDDVYVQCNKIQLSQIIINLLNNSFFALGGLKNKKINISLAQVGKNIVLSIEDSGNGVSTEIKDKIMDPFFTTKPIGEGTGLGLSISKGLVKTFGGDLYLDENSEMTKFCIALQPSDSETKERAS